MVWRGHSYPGHFITFEGGEGAGKTTQIRLLKDYLSAQNNDVRTLREPGGTPIGEEIRHLLKHSEANKGMVPEAELLLFNASRTQIVQEVIRPALQAGEYVLCDRFYDSTKAYQGYGRGLNMQAITSIIDFACQGIRPDITFFFDVSPEQGRARRAAQIRQEQSRVSAESSKSELLLRDRFEEEEKSFFDRVHRGYLELIAAEPERFCVVPDVSVAETEKYILEQLRLHSLIAR